MLNRRNFLKSSALLYGGVGFMRSASVFPAVSKPSGFFGVHPFVEQHPEAVFIMRTRVDYKTNSEACKRVGLDFGRSVFVPMDNTGIPVTHNIATKPNLTAHQTIDKRRGLSLEDTMGITTDAFFIEGLFESLKELGVPGNKMHTRDVNGGRVIEPRGYVAMGQRVGANVVGKTEIATAEDANDAGKFVWKEVPGGVVYRQIPYIWPFNAPDAWNLNVAKFKAHTMGLTLTSKNWQGSNASPFQHYCGRWPAIGEMQQREKVVNKECINPKVRELVDADFKRHISTIPRWDTPDFPRETPGYVHLYGYSTICMELWAHRTIDNHAASPMGLHIIEGIYGRDGDFNMGPNPFGSENDKEPWSRASTSRNGRAWDYMTNIVIFGKNPYLVDIVGHWLGGHEPGNFGLFHIAMERGKLNVMNPMNIPVYEWQDGIAVRRPLTGFTRTPLRTSYLHQYLKNEPLWHLCDEPFDYTKVPEKKSSIPERPTTRVLNQHCPNANNPQLAIEYSIPEKGWTLVEILDQDGNNLEVISSAICDPGYHMAAWNTAKYESGRYKYRLRYNDYNEVHDLVLQKS